MFAIVIAGVFELSLLWHWVLVVVTMIVASVLVLMSEIKSAEPKKHRLLVPAGKLESGALLENGGSDFVDVSSLFAPSFPFFYRSYSGRV